MSITNIKKRVACFYDDKGEYIGKKSFSKTAQTFKFNNKAFNIYHGDDTFLVTSTLIKRWYWDIELYHYNINNPNPIILNKKAEPILDSEMYNIQLETKVARDLNDLSKGGLFDNLNMKTVFILIIIGAIVYLVASGKVKF